MVANNLAVREWTDNQLHQQAQQYPLTPADLEGAAKMNRSRENLEEIEHRIDARFTPEVRTLDELIRRALTDKQLAAISWMVQGMSDAEIARGIEVHRATVARWRLFHPTFIAELNRRRQEEIAQTADRMRRLAMISIEVLEKQLLDESNPALRLKAAITLLKMSGVERAAKERKPLSAEEIVDDIALSHRKRAQGIIDNGEREEALRDLALRAETCHGGPEAVCKTQPNSNEPDPAVPDSEDLPVSPQRNGSDIPPVENVEAPVVKIGDKAQQTHGGLPDCCAPKSRIGNGLSFNCATGATRNISHFNPLPSPI